MKRLKWVALGLLLLLLAGWLGVYLLLRSAWLHEQLRARIVLEAEKMTGGKVELQGFHFDADRWLATADGFTLHGTEPASAAPLLRIRRIQVGLKVLSFLRKQVDVRALVLQQPEVNLIVGADGKTNWPGPQRDAKGNPVDPLIALASEDLIVREGLFQYGDLRQPFAVLAKQVQLRLAFTPSTQVGASIGGTAEASYQGELRAELPEVSWQGKRVATPQYPATLSAKIGLYRNRLAFFPLELGLREARLVAEGELRDWQKLDWQAKLTATAPLPALATIWGQELGAGSVSFEGAAMGQGGSKVELQGSLAGTGLRPPHWPVGAATMAAKSKVEVRVQNGLLNLQAKGISVTGQDLSLIGDLELAEGQLRYQGELNRLNLLPFLPATYAERLSGPLLARGPVTIQGSLRSADSGSGASSSAATFRSSLSGNVNLKLDSAANGANINGQLAASFDLGRNLIQLQPSRVETPGLKLMVDGNLALAASSKGEGLTTGNSTAVSPMPGFHAVLESTDLAELLRLAGLSPADVQVVLLPSGSLRFEGTTTSANANSLEGQFLARNLQYRQQIIQSVQARLRVAPNLLDVRELRASLDKATLAGEVSLGLAGWRSFNGSGLRANLRLEDFPLAQLEKSTGRKLPVSGTASVAARLEGTLDAPTGSARFALRSPVYLQPGGAQLAFDNFQGNLRLAGNSLLAEGLELTRGPAKLLGFGRYQRRTANWESGDANFTWELSGVNVAEFRDLLEWREAATGRLTLAGQAAAFVDLRPNSPTASREAIQLQDLKFNGRLDEITLEGRSMGALQLAGETRANQLDFRLNGNLSGSPLNATGRLGLRQSYPLEFQLQVGTIPFALLRDLRPSSARRDPFPFDGNFSASLRLSGPAADPERWRADIEIPQVEVRATRQPRLTLARSNSGSGATTTAQPVTSALAADFVLRNQGPVQFTLEGRTITVKKAQFVAKDTNLSASGNFSLADRRPWDLRVIGDLNLVGLKTFLPDVATGGKATLDANIKGVLADPQVFGRLDLQDASLYLENLPTGLDKVNGRVLFDRQRATIENKLTAQTGGGELTLSGFVDFSQEEAFYRLLGSAANVRIRYPEGVSTQADAALTLTGTSKSSILGGTITVLRSGFIQRTDLGSLLSESSRAPAEVPSANSFLNNMQLDIKLRTAPNTQFTTSLTSDLQAEGNLQVRGTAAKPAVLGRVSVNAGSISFFGNVYTIKRGEISFYNPTRIEPVLDLDLETRVRGVTVGINFSGPVNKLNTSYRSDPPLQSNEIIALLTVGRSPDKLSYGTPGNARGSLFDTGANTLLGNAISAPISSQLQRFFGVSRIKIDPFISGLEGIPQARVTLEQQVSKDVTLTFVTNLNRSQQQIVRLEWNVSREWSLIALRDENGSFGLDFQFRRQFK